MKQTFGYDGAVFSGYKSIFGDTDGNKKNIPISSLRPFEGHPFSVREDGDFDALCSSIRENGVLEALIVRKTLKGNSEEYTILSGHRRCAAAEKTGFNEVPCIIRECSDDDAALIMVDSNLHRTSLPISEKANAMAIKMKILLKRRELGDTSNKGRTRDILGKEVGITGRYLQKLLCISRLPSSLQQLLDDGMLSVKAGVEVSYLDDAIQKKIASDITNGIKIPLEAFREMRSLTGPDIRGYTEIVNKYRTAPDNIKDSRSVITYGQIREFLPAGITEGEIRQLIISLLKERQKR